MSVGIQLSGVRPKQQEKLIRLVSLCSRVENIIAGGALRKERPYNCTPATPIAREEISAARQSLVYKN